MLYTRLPKHTFVVVCLLVLPSLNPYTFGPTPSVVPWLVSIFCAVALVGYWISTHAEAESQIWTSLVVWAWITAAALNAVIALVQYSGESATLSPWITVSQPGEAYGNLRQRNQFATLTNIGLVALMWMIERPRRRTGKVISDWPWVPLCIVLLVSANAASGSRTGMVQLILVLALFSVWQPQNRPLLTDSRFMVAVAGYALAAVFFGALANVQTFGNGGILGRVQELGTPCSSRTVLWSNVVYLIGLRPWIGWGWGELDYAHFMTLYPGERFCDILDNAHNLPLHLAVELGLPFAFVSMGLLIWWVLRNRPWADRDPARQMAWAVLAVIGLHSLLEYPLWYGPFQLAVGLCLLILWRTRQTPAAHVEADQRSLVSATQSRVIEWIAICACLTALAAAAWDYWRISQLYKPLTARTPAYRDHTLEKVSNTWFFQDQVQFAELTTVSLKPSNALQHYAQAQRLLHFSPEPRVIEAAIESAVMLGKDEEALYYLQRYKAAFPDAHSAWAAKSARFVAP